MSDESRAGQWMKSNLAAIGSAAVLTVYAAGFARTKEAADRLAEESERRRPNMRPIPATATGQVVSAEPQPAARVAAASTNSSHFDTKSAGADAAKSPSPGLETTAAATTKPSAAVPAPGTSAAPAPTAQQAVAPAPAPAATPTSSAAIAPGTMAPPADAPPIGSSTTAANSQTRSAGDTSTAAAGYKDGVFAGWGTSRHGDIQAYVEIKGGKIVSAFISECLTQYSCSWIVKLPPQAVDRQSAEIDYVSGATQSSNALYYALVDALKKAK